MLVPHLTSLVSIDLDLAKLTLNDMGEIQNCSQTCEQVFGYRQDELAGRHISTLLPELGDTELVQEGRINSRLAFLCHCAFSFQARRRDGNSFTSELCRDSLPELVPHFDVVAGKREQLAGKIQEVYGIGKDR